MKPSSTDHDNNVVRLVPSSAFVLSRYRSRDGKVLPMVSPKTAKRSPINLPERLLYSRAETAEMLGVSVRLIKRWQLAGKLRATKPGGDKGQVFFTRSEIDRFLKDSTR